MRLFLLPVNPQAVFARLSFCNPSTPFPFCLYYVFLKIALGVSSLKARAFLERKRLLGDNRGINIAVQTYNHEQEYEHRFR